MTTTSNEVLWRKYKDKVGRIVTAFKDTVKHTYKVTVQLYNKHGESMLVDSYGNSVVMLVYTFQDRQSCIRELTDKYPRETKIADK